MTRPHRSPVASRELSRLRAALTVFFALDGFVFAGWVVRIPAIKDQTGASPASLGLALLGVSAGAVLTMTLTGRLCERFGPTRLTIAMALLMSAAVALPPLTHSALALGLVLVLLGAAYGSMSVALNSAAVDLIAVLRRPVMPALHAVYSLGGVLGAGLGALVAGRLTPTWHLLLVAVTGLAVTALTGRALLAHPLPRAAPEPVTGPRRRGNAPRVLVAVFGLIALCTAYGEGAMAEWGALHLRESLGAGAGLAAAGYSVFAATMTIGRLSGTVLLLRLGETRAVALGGVTAAVGMLAGSQAPTVWLALAGYAVTGLGLANIFPIAIARAGALGGPGGVAAASTLGYGGMLVGPPAIGFLAEWFSLSTALATVALLAAVAAVIAVTTGRAAAGNARRVTGR
ncbi:Inner membrane protein YbjJ [Streptomyces sp. RB5]|uniref:Inner membrane protein YbjJ n=1 Tax=Streptomyces smaragdinus TaxID=2585196 RepID=A0A7K0CE09_9ACTN|nr:MFS transporter [Streptomyces smaragdinus]MQY11708.1 Inner membrane protein YbjJ [Streptomyces smaragdinus]